MAQKLGLCFAGLTLMLCSCIDQLECESLETRRLLAVSGYPAVLLDDFESTEIRRNGQTSSTPSNNLLWNQREPGGTGFEETSTEESHDGNRSLKITLESKEMYSQFLPTRQVAP